MELKPARLLVAALAVALSATAFWFGTGLHPQWWLTWLAPVPVLLIAPRLRASTAFMVALLAHVVGALNMWSYSVGVVPIPVLLAIVLGPACGFALGVLMFRAFLRRGALWLAVLTPPALRVASEYIVAATSIHGTFGVLGYTQMNCLPLLQIASLTGIWSLSFCIFLFSSALAVLLSGSTSRHQRVVVGCATGLFLAVVFSFGFWRLSTAPSAPAISVGLVASDLPENRDPRSASASLEVFRRYADQVPALAAQGAQLIVMPEHTGAYIADSLGGNATEVDRLFTAVAVRNHVYILIGVDHVVTEKLMWNQGRLYSPEETAPAVYNKQHMLPPFESSFTIGTTLTTIANSSGRWGLAICKDLDFPKLGRQYGNAGIGLLLVPAYDFTDDSWLHGRMAILRGVESGFSMARVAKNGSLTLSDSRGRVLAEVRSGSAPFATLVASIPVHPEATWYARFGDWFAWLDLVLFVTILTALVFRRQKSPSQ